ncbi:type I polyketide synthase [Caballeronia cordobensis]|uniref:type I polyketide synthase n=1 Tax=Caballeronia cordobensis TaxID=1353886 RepID=UPI0006AD7F18|nr:type I polyketide synthase [Caballeronia cordobensis]
MNEKIAIVGMACRFPGGVTNPDEFWELLRNETDAVTEIPAGRFGTDFYRHPNKREPGRSYTFAAGVLDDVAGFDANFFGISPREAAQMDPQQRLLLELTWEAFEDAGMQPRAMRGTRCGVYVGVASPDYGNRSMDDLSAIDPYSATGNTLSIASNRLSYLFDLRGPSMSIDTACSSSLVALHQAVRSLETGEADTAIAGGVNLLLHPFGFVTFSKASMLSPRGRCRAFDATGDGYVRAEGGAVVVLKTLARALADGDTIHAVIAGTGVNSDGFSQGGISVPGAATQAELLRTVYARAGVDPHDVDYMEAHGTGTAVGDPIETRALIEVAGAGRDAKRPLLIGSVKTNIGHLETASGMAGLFKAILCLRHRAAPRSLHFDTPNPNIDFEGGRLRVVERLTSLGQGDGPLVVGVNSFGFGGTNAHVVLTSLPAVTDDAPVESRDDDALYPLVISARSRDALAALAGRYLARLEAGAAWNALAAAAAHRRQWLEERAVIAPASLDEAREALHALASPDSTTLPPAVATGQAVEDEARAALVFSGNGSQWAGMGKRLLEESAAFRAAIAEVDALWTADGSASLLAMLEAGVDAPTIAATEYAQPLLFAMQVGVVRALVARGIEYHACTGHSVGEVAAAWAAGALPLADAVQVIKIRSRAQALTRGSGRMCAAGIGEGAAHELIAQLGLQDEVEIAGVNSPDAVTLAGSLADLTALGETLEQSGRFVRMLDLDYAFHSRHMDAIEPMIRDALADLHPASDHGLFVSTVTGGALDGRALDAAYWWRNIRQPVRFYDAIACIANEGVRVFIEVGPHSILRSYIKESLAASNVAGVALPTLKRHHDTAAMLAHAALSAVAHGARMARERFVPRGVLVHDVSLPAYPWQRERHWNALTAEGYGLVDRRREHPLLGYRLSEHAFAWENQIDPARIAYLADHVVDGGVTFPGAGFLEMALAAGRAFFGTASCALENFEIGLPVVFQGAQAKTFRLIVDSRTSAFTIETRDRLSSEAWSLNVTGRLLASGTTLTPERRVVTGAFDALLRQPSQPGALLYANAEAIGLSYGPAFRWVREVRVGERMALAELARPDALNPDALAHYLLHPALTDSGFHPLFALLAREAGAARAAYVPVQIGRADFVSGDIARVLVTIERFSPHSVVATFEFIGTSGGIAARLSACRFRRVDLAGRRQSAAPRYVYRLEQRPQRATFDASSIPEPAVLVEAATAQLAARAGDDRRAMHLTEILPLLDVLASCHALRALDTIGAFDAPFPPECAQPALAERLAAMLVEDGLATREGVRLVRDADACAALPFTQELWSSLLAQSPAHVAELTLLGDYGAALPALLKGEIDARALMTPTSESLIEHLFESSPTWGHARALIAGCVTQASSAWRTPRRLRVLEIGRLDVEVPRPLPLMLTPARCDHAIACSAAQEAALAAEAASGARMLTVDDANGFALPDDEVPFDVLILDRFLSTRRDAPHVLKALRERLAPDALVLVSETRASRFADIVLAQRTDDAPVRFAPGEVSALLEQAGFERVVQVHEQQFDLEGMPTLMLARAGRQAHVSSQTAPVDASASTWLLAYADACTGSVNALSAALHAAGVRVEALALSAVRDVLSATPDATPLRIVYVAPEAGPSVDGMAALAAQENTSIALARLVRDLAAHRGSAQLTVVTRGGAPFAVPGIPAAALRPEQATLWGLCRVLANEHPELGCRLVDVSPECGDAGALLAGELLNHDGEEEVVLTPLGRYVPRMLDAADHARLDAADEMPAVTPTALGFEHPGSLRNLQWLALADAALAADEVEIEPVATGLNFRDVMYAMGLLSDEAVEAGFAGATIGMEVSGRIVRVGRDVTAFAPGDAVLGFAPASFATRVRTTSTAIGHKPAALTFEEAATIPTAFFTVYYALVELARVRRGERVLIHGGAGGVGIAAIQLARHLGAEVFATAGSREKREFVRLLGADHVLDSRSLAFADDVLELTGGAGVDVVLNSLAGEAMVRSIDTLRPFGRFLELGKRDFYENSKIGLRPFRNNISYFGIDADQLMKVMPDLTRRLFDEMLALFGDGSLHPLPYRTFPAARAEDAFRYMQQARQIGKVLVNYPAGVPAPARMHVPDAPLRFDADAVWLLIGGTGGLGFATARWLIAHGVRHITLASRRGVLDEAMREEADQWRDAFGAHVHVASCDTTDAAALRALVAQIDARGVPLRGVLHSAMHIDDGLLRNLDDQRFAAVLAPKLAGAWNLHRETIHHDLDYFIVYSSATTALGNPGQSSYVAANTYLEALVQWRRAAGLPGVGMAWGPLVDVGFLARNDKTREALQSRIGGAAFSSDEALAMLGETLREGGAGSAVVRLDWQALARGMPAASARRYASMRLRGSAEPVGEGGRALRAQILALPRDEAAALVEETLRAQIARILHLSAERVQVESSVLDMGMDSLMGMELGMAIEEIFDVKLSVMAIADGATVRSLGARILESIESSLGDADAPDTTQETLGYLAKKHAVDVGAKSVDAKANAHAAPADAASDVSDATELVE